MRTTVTIDDALLDAARQIALAERRSLGSVVEDAMRALLPRRAAARESEPYGGGHAPGIDLGDNARLLDVLEGAA
ncbi:MAG: type II toxin-antitoxin system VapB family antitoxin [Kineosporiaceae bacterium]